MKKITILFAILFLVFHYQTVGHVIIMMLNLAASAIHLMVK
jgi:hypothetical protein